MLRVAPPSEMERMPKATGSMGQRGRSSAAQVIAVLVLMGAATVGVTSASGASPSMVRLARLAPPTPPRGAIQTGPLPHAQSIDFEVVLAPSHQAQLTSLVHSLYAVGSTQYHHWLTPTEFTQRFAPAPAAVSQLRGWLTSLGLHSTYRSGFGVHVSGSASAIGAGFGVSLNDYRLQSGQQIHMVNRAPLLPAVLSGEVLSVLGLEDAPRLTPHLVRDGSIQGPRLLPRAEGLSPCVSAPPGADTPDQVGAAYDIGDLTAAGQTGVGQTVAVYELATHLASDTGAYERCFGLYDPVTTVTVDGGGTPGAEGTAEADADIEQVATQAPGASIVSYEGPDTLQGAYDTWNAIVSQDTANIVSTSFGLCEPDSSSGGVIAADDTLFLQAALQGQTILAASGDSGSEDCYTPSAGTDTSLEVDYPASSPSVTAVGGTTLFADGTQTAWNDCEGQTDSSCANLGGGAGGGGVSRFEERPSWQPAEWEWGNSSNACGTNCRDVPDISDNAGTPELFFAEGSRGGYIGTSVAAPLVAGILADTAEGCSEVRRGIVAQALYDLVAQGAYATVLSDVTTGDNDLTRTYAGAEFPSTSGYDPATGLGTPIAGGWSCPEVLSISPTEAQPSAEVTIRGLGLEKAAVSFGGIKAQIVSETATSVTAVVPAGSGTVTVTAANLMGAGTFTSAFTYTPPPQPLTSLPPPSQSGFDLVGQDGGVFAFPTSELGGFFGSLPGLGIGVRDIAGMVPSPDDRGYFLVGQDGGVFAFGDAPFLGSLPGLHVNVHDIRGIVPTGDNRGYFLVGRDGGVFAFGDAPFLGSLPGEGIHITDVVGIAATPSDQGYWVVAGNGTVYAFGTASNLGSADASTSPVSGISSTPDGGGYWIVTQDGGVFAFGDAGYFGSLPSIRVSPASPVIGLVPTADDEGYSLIGSDGGIFTFGDARFIGSLPGIGIHITDIVGAVPTTL